MNETFTQNPLEKLLSEIEDWESNEVAAFLKKQAERKEQFFTTGDFPVQRVYTAADVAETPLEDIGLPGRYPFTRGPTRRCTAAGCGPCARSPVSAPAKTPTNASNI